MQNSSSGSPEKKIIFTLKVQLTEVVYLTLHEKNHLISRQADKTEARMYQNVGFVLR
jgi:hypothetical protein